MNKETVAWFKLPNSSEVLGSDLAGMSQRRCFELSPNTYLERALQSNATKLPKLLIGYGPLMEKLSPALQQHGYSLWKHFWNCWWQTDADIFCKIEIWRLGAV